MEVTRPTCERHDAVIEATAKAAASCQSLEHAVSALSEDVRRNVDRLCGAIDAHCATGGHPPLIARVTRLEERHGELSDEVRGVRTVADQTLTEVRGLQAGREERAQGLDRSSKVWVAMIVALSTLVTALLTYYKV
jgi:hypothetical protein